MSNRFLNISIVIIKLNSSVSFITHVSLDVLDGFNHIVFNASSLKNFSKVFLSPFPKPKEPQKLEYLKPQ